MGDIFFCLKNHDSLSRRNWSPAIPHHFFTDLLLGGKGFERKLFHFQLSPENKQGQKQKLHKVIDFAGGLNRTSRDYPSAEVELQDLL